MDVIDLKIYSPIEILFEDEVKKLTFQGKEGYLTILPNHIDYVSSFESNVMTFIDKNNNQKFVALSNGIIVKYSNKVRLTAYKAVIEDNLKELKKNVNEIAKKEDDIAKEINKNLKQLEYYMFSNFINMK